MRTLIVFLFAFLLVSCHHDDRDVHKELPPIYGDITVCTSDDNKVRFYSFEDDRSGTASSYINIAEFINESGNIVRLEKPIAELITGKREELAPGFEIIKIYTIAQNKYILLAHGKECSSVGCGVVAALQIKNDELIAVNAFNGNSYVSFEYNFFDDYFETMTDEESFEWSWLCKYDSITSTLLLRKFDVDGDLTNEFTNYIIEKE